MRSHLAVREAASTQSKYILFNSSHTRNFRSTPPTCIRTSTYLYSIVFLSVSTSAENCQLRSAQKKMTKPLLGSPTYSILDPRRSKPRGLNSELRESPPFIQGGKIGRTKMWEEINVLELYCLSQEVVSLYLTRQPANAVRRVRQLFPVAAVPRKIHIMGAYFQLGIPSDRKFLRHLKLSPLMSKPTAL